MKSKKKETKLDSVKYPRIPLIQEMLAKYRYDLARLADLRKRVTRLEKIYHIT